VRRDLSGAVLVDAAGDNSKGGKATLAVKLMPPLSFAQVMRVRLL
jgi:hypothetical protein